MSNKVWVTWEDPISGEDLSDKVVGLGVGDDVADLRRAFKVQQELQISPAKVKVRASEGGEVLDEDRTIQDIRQNGAGISKGTALVLTLPPVQQQQQDDDQRDGKISRLSYEGYKDLNSARKYAETDWKEQQEKAQICHLRPPGCSYLPVFIMHEAFDKMANIIENGNMFEDEDFALAGELLTVMGKAFQIEDQRRDVVNSIFNEKIFIKLKAPINVLSIQLVQLMGPQSMLA